MKRLYVAFVLIVFSFAICLISSSKVEKQSLDMQRQLTLMGTEIKKGNRDEANRLIAQAEKKWESAETLFSFIVDADKIEEMSISFAMIKKHLEDNNREHALERLRECELMLVEITENERLSIKNIM